ncbi:MAG: hypothetical protein ACREKN_02090 [Longimicrobiaceae bacterium]
MPRTIQKGAFTLLAPIAVLFAACANPVNGADEELEPVDVVIRDLSGNLIAETHGDHWDVEGEGGHGHGLELEVAGELEVRVFFVAEDGSEFQVEHEEDELVVEIDDASVARYHDHGDHGDFVGVTEGETTALILLWHGDYPDTGHSHYQSPPLEIGVVNLQ